MDLKYWYRQSANKPLYPDIEWSKPEQRSRAGKLAIIGGNKLGFASVGEAYTTAQSIGVAELKVLLPDCLRKTIPASITDAIFGASNPSGGFARTAINEIKAVGEWSDAVLLIGDSGRNAETAILYEDFILDYSGQLTVTRDAIDLIINNPKLLVERPNTLIVVSFAQLQKLFQSVYYPKVLTFSMQLVNLVEVLHKFTISYPLTVAVLHKDNILVSNAGIVSSTIWNNPMAIWRGTTATNAAVYQMWHPNKPLEAVTTSLF